MAAHKPRRPRGAALPLAEAPRRIPISIRIAPDTLEAFRATGPGWQVRMNAVLDKAAARLAPAGGN